MPSTKFIGYALYREETDDYLSRVKQFPDSAVLTCWCRTPEHAKLYSRRAIHQVAIRYRGIPVAIYETDTHLLAVNLDDESDFLESGQDMYF